MDDTVTFNLVIRFIDADAFSLIYGISWPISLEIVNNEKLQERDSRYNINVFNLVSRDFLERIPKLKVVHFTIVYVIRHVLSILISRKLSMTQNNCLLKSLMKRITKLLGHVTRAKKIQETSDAITTSGSTEKTKGGRVLPFVSQGHTLSWRIIYRRCGPPACTLGY